MALETGTYIDDLVSSNPPQSDSLTQAAGHLRLIKSTILATFPNITGAISSTDTAIDAAVTTATANQYVPAGCIFDFAGTSLPTGYLWCNGAAVSRTTYSGLFTAISTTFGTGDGSTTFNLPDYRDRFAVGKADMGGVSDAAIIDSLLTTTTLGATYDGEGAIDTITLVEANLPSVTANLSGGTAASNGAHTHSVTGTTTSSSTQTFVYQVNVSTLAITNTSNNTVMTQTVSPFETTVVSTGSLSNGAAASNGAHTHTVTGSISFGSDTPFTVDILPPSLVVNVIIKT